MLINPAPLAWLVDGAVDLAKQDAAPFVPSHAQVAARLQPVVEFMLWLPRDAAQRLFRQVRPGTWDAHVLAECKSAWTLADAPAPRAPISNPRWRA